MFPEDLDFTGILTQQLTSAAPPVDVPAERESAPPALDRLLAQLLSARPEDRPASASSVRDQLRELAYAGTGRGSLAHAPAGASAAAAGAALPPAWRQRLAVGGAVALMFALTLGVLGMGLGYALGSSDEHDDAEAMAAAETAVEEEAAEASAEGEAPAGSGDPTENPLVRQLLHSSSGSERRAAARALLASGDALPMWVSAVARYEGASGCSERRAAVEGIVAAQHPSATAALERTVNASRRGCGTLGMRDCYSCFRSAAERGLRTLRGN
jgi:hypothetical protein